MTRDLLNHYFNKEDLRYRIMPIGVDVVSLDYYLYLYAGRDNWFVIVEVDYLSGLPGIAKDIEASFRVVVEGWCVLKQRQQEAGRDLLPPDSDDYDPDGTNDINHNSYVQTVHSEHGMRYTVARVKPESGFRIEDFDLTFYTQSASD